MNEQEIEQFWRRVDVRGEDECWLWTAGLMRAGEYGECRLGGERGAHRVSWRIANGPIPAGYHVRHLCQGPKRCVYPRHLDAAPQRINSRDEKIKHLSRPCPIDGTMDRRPRDNRCRECVNRARRTFNKRQLEAAARPARRPARSRTRARAGRRGALR